MKTEFLRTVYDQILEKDPDCIRLAKKADEEISKVAQAYSGIMDAEQLESMTDAFVDALSPVMFEAYKTGAKHCLKLIYETIAE